MQICKIDLIRYPLALAPDWYRVSWAQHQKNIRGLPSWQGALQKVRQGSHCLRSFPPRVKLPLPGILEEGESLGEAIKDLTKAWLLDSASWCSLSKCWSLKKKKKPDTCLFPGIMLSSLNSIRSDVMVYIFVVCGIKLQWIHQPIGILSVANGPK